MWVNPNCATSGNPEGCAGNGVFNYGLSSTVQLTGSSDGAVLLPGKSLDPVGVRHGGYRLRVGFRCRLHGNNWSRHEPVLWSWSRQQLSAKRRLGRVTAAIWPAAVSVFPGQYGQPEAYRKQSFQFRSRGLGLALQVRDSANDQKSIKSLIVSLQDLSFSGGVDLGKFVGALQKCPILDPAQTPDKINR